jgi:hypothetical protein
MTNPVAQDGIVQVEVVVQPSLQSQVLHPSEFILYPLAQVLLQ